MLSLAPAAGCALWIAVDVRRRPPHMGIMQVVWPVCTLFGGPLLLWFYLRHGRAPHGGHDGHMDHEGHSDQDETPMPIAVATGALHCGSGCTLGDAIAETLAFAVPGVLVLAGHGTVFPERMFAVWVLDFVLAFVIGIVFQYFAIAPMRKDLGVAAGIWAAVKADALSLVSWQVGMYGLMAVATFLVYRPWLGHEPDAASPVFWFTMQLAMVAGFVTAYPTDWALIRAGVKERM